MHALLLPLLLAATAASPVSAKDNLPTVVWHGLGDSADSEGILSILDLLSNHTQSPAFAISTGARDSSFLGNINAQLETVCATLRDMPALRNGFNGIGFSQGGQFLRSYVQRCNVPRMHNLMTWGSQHAGIVEVPCKQTDSTLCQSSRFLVKSNAFLPFVQNRIVPAQYYKGFDHEAYIKGSIFLADVNNERTIKNETYATNLGMLDKFIMIMFKDDATVIPKQSSLFEDVDEDGNVTPIEQTTYYKDLGLDVLAQRDALIQLTVDGEHMQIDTQQLLEFVDMYFTNTSSSQIRDAKHDGL